MDGPAASTGAPRDGAREASRARREFLVGTALLAAGFAFAAVGSAIVQRGGGAPTSQLLAGLAAQALFACTALGGALLAGPALLPHGLRMRRPRLAPRDLALLALGFVCTSHALSVLLSLVSLRETGTLAELDRIVAATTAGPPRLLAFLAIGLAPAFGEELLFRGLVQELARRRLRAAGAILVSSLAFAAVHLDPVHSPAAFVLGLYLGTAAWLGASVWTAALCHGANNVLGVVLPQLAIDIPPDTAPAWVAGLGAAGVLLLGSVARRARAPGRGAGHCPGGPAASL